MSLRLKLAIALSVVALTSVAASSAEVAILQNGRSIRFQRREPREAVTRLYFGESPNSYVEVPTDQIARFEEEVAEELRPAQPGLRPSPPPTLKELVSVASTNNNIDPDLVMTLIRVESGFDANAVSPKGALGLLQLMPRTATRLGVTDPLDPAANLQGGTRYLRELLDRYHNDLAKALAAYNAGPGRVEQYHGVPPYPETQSYIAKVIYDLRQKKVARVLAHPDLGSERPALRNPKSPAATPEPQPSPESVTRTLR